jgi:hypothetical protein
VLAQIEHQHASAPARHAHGFGQGAGWILRMMQRLRQHCDVD